MSENKCSLKVGYLKVKKIHNKGFLRAKKNEFLDLGAGYTNWVHKKLPGSTLKVYALDVALKMSKKQHIPSL